MSKWNDLPIRQRAALIRAAVSNGISDLSEIQNKWNEFDEGGSIHIKPENRGKFTELKERTGHSTSWFIEHGTPAQKKMAVFANNARRWKHGEGGHLFDGETEQTQYMSSPNTVEISRQNTLNRADSVASNYQEAKDWNNDFWSNLRLAANNRWGKGLSNCTLSATQWVNPLEFYKSAASIVNNPDSGYVQIDAQDALPGDLLIAQNPNEGSYHTMLINGFDSNNQPLLTYSRGKNDTDSNLVTNRSLSEYHRLDNEQGGSHTKDYYFRPTAYNENWLPEITVVAPRIKAYGGSLPREEYIHSTGGPLYPFSFVKGILPAVRYGEGGFL